MNITPALPNPYPSSVAPDKTAIAAVRAPNRVRDAVDEPERRQQPVQRIEPSQRERLAAQVEAVPGRQLDGSVRVSRALASYAEVSEGGERKGLHDLLGFDAYA